MTHAVSQSEDYRTRLEMDSLRNQIEILRKEVDRVSDSFFNFQLLLIGGGFLTICILILKVGLSR